MSALRNDSLHAYVSTSEEAMPAFNKLEADKTQLVRDVETVLDFRVTPYIKHMEAAIELLEKRIETLERRR
ncbi:MAG: hypothetical protein ACYYKD_11025 [Rhodospirillales bacterium]